MNERKSNLDVTKQLANFAATLDHEVLPGRVQDLTRLFVLDGLGIMLGAVAFARRDEDHCLERYLEFAAPDGPQWCRNNPYRLSHG